MCLMLASRHSLTWEAILDILKLINQLFNRENVVPETKYKVLQFVPMDINSMKFHFYCRTCHKYLGEQSTAKAGNSIICTTCDFVLEEPKVSYFVTLGFESQVKKLLENPEVVKCLGYRFERKRFNKDALEDIYDGRMYTNLSKPGSPLNSTWNLSYTFNTDGCQAANSSRVSVWPIYASINELPPKMRSKHMILVGLWADKSEPNMNLFMTPFIKEANVLSSVGIKWQLNNSTITSLILPTVCAVDSIARADLLNIKRMNAVNGCTFCEHQTECVESYRRYTVSTTVHPDRTDESIKQGMLRAANTGNDEIGIKGPSALMNLQYFDLADGMVPDYMHSVLLGVARQHTELLMSSPKEEYYAGSPSQIQMINCRLESIRPPKCITRTPRGIHERKMWKASEWRSWLVFYSLVCLPKVIPQKYVEHLAMFVCAIHLLLQNSITQEMLQTADNLLVKYIVTFQTYFGKKSMTYNVHLLFHLVKSVENWGPLWATNCFPFEDANRLLLIMKKSPNQIAVQVSRKFLFIKALLSFSNQFVIRNEVREFCDKLYGKQVKFYTDVDNCRLIGSGKPYELSTDEGNSLGLQVFDCKTYKKIIYNGVRYTSEAYDRCTKTNDSVIYTIDKGVGIITNICRLKSESDEEKVVIFMKRIRLENSPYISTTHVKVVHIQRCYIDQRILICIPLTSIDCQGILMKIANNYYITKIVHGCLGD